MSVEDAQTHAEQVAREAARRLWPGTPVVIEDLPGGLTNANFKVTVGDQVYALRVQATNVEELGIDRRAEEAASRGAAAAGVAPAVVATLADPGVLVTEFIHGSQPSMERMREKDLIERLGSALKCLHGSRTSIPLNFNPFRAVEHYFRQVVAAGLPGANDYQPLMEIVARIEPVIGFRCTVPSHCDLMCVNLLEDHDRGLWLIDWDYAGMSDWRQDLSDVSGYHEYEAEHDAELLRAYAGSVTNAEIAELRTLRFMILIRCALWGAAQKVSGELAQGDYDDWIEEWTERSRAYAVTEDFLRSITFLESQGPGRSGEEG